MTNNQLTDVKFFTKKPVTISAIQWTGDNLAQVIEFTGKHPRWGEWFKSIDEYIAHVRDDGNRFKIFTLEGVMDALPGDWIIRGVQGERYPCKPDIFAETYAPAELQERRKADSEPVAWLWSRDDERDVSLTPPDDDEDAADAIECGWTATPLYRHAQQPTVVGDGRAEFETWMLKRWGRERRDDDFAMGKFIYGEDYADSYTRCVWKAWSASRAAMLQAGNSPVIPEGYVMVPKEPTEAMINAWLSEVANWRGHVAGYKAMLATAPQEVNSES